MNRGSYYPTYMTATSSVLGRYIRSYTAEVILGDDITKIKHRRVIPLDHVLRSVPGRQEDRSS